MALDTFHRLRHHMSSTDFRLLETTSNFYVCVKNVTSIESNSKHKRNS